MAFCQDGKMLLCNEREIPLPSKKINHEYIHTDSVESNEVIENGFDSKLKSGAANATTLPYFLKSTLPSRSKWNPNVSMMDGQNLRECKEHICAYNNNCSQNDVRYFVQERCLNTSNTNTLSTGTYLLPRVVACVTPIQDSQMRKEHKNKNETISKPIPFTKKTAFIGGQRVAIPKLVTPIGKKNKKYFGNAGIETARKHFFPPVVSPNSTNCDHFILFNSDHSKYKKRSSVSTSKATREKATSRNSLF